MNSLSPAPAAPRSSCSRCSTPSSAPASNRPATVSLNSIWPFADRAERETRPHGGVRDSRRPIGRSCVVHRRRRARRRACDDTAGERDAAHECRFRRERQARADRRDGRRSRRRRALDRRAAQRRAHQPGRFGDHHDADRRSRRRPRDRRRAASTGRSCAAGPAALEADECENCPSHVQPVQHAHVRRHRAGRHQVIGHVGAVGRADTRSRSPTDSSSP